MHYPAHAPHVPDVFLESQDKEVTRDDHDRLLETDSPLRELFVAYAGYPGIQERVVIEDNALLRLTNEKPYTYAALLAKARTSDFTRETSLTPANGFDGQASGRLWFKNEYELTGGSFKLRGAANKILQLSLPELLHGIKAPSHGNHALGCAIVCHALGIPFHAYMPVGDSSAKMGDLLDWGAILHAEGDDFEAAYAACLRTDGEAGLATLAHPYDDHQVMTGQSVIAVDLLTRMPKLRRVYVPIGGGGLISDTAAVLKENDPSIEVVGVQSEHNNSAQLSKLADRREANESSDSYSDGTALKAPGVLTFPNILSCVDRIVTVSNLDIARTILRHEQVYGQQLEVAGWLAGAAMHAEAHDAPDNTIAILTGRNVAPEDWAEHTRMLQGSRSAERELQAV